MTNTTNNNTYTQKLYAIHAQLFLLDMHNNPKLKQQWDSLLQNIKTSLSTGDSKQTYATKYKTLANFLISNGYNTTPNHVSDQVKAKWHANYQKQFVPNADSDKFVQAILNSSNLLADWHDTLKKEANGTEKPDAANNFLKQKGYSCDKNQVVSSFHQARSQKLSYWSGIYGNSVLTPQSGGDSIPGPIITIYNDLEFGVAGYTIDQKLSKVTYKDNVLTWEQDDFGTQSTEGKITFAQVTRAALNDHPYIGNEFFGTITFKSAKTIGKQTYQGAYSIMGRIGKPQKKFSSHAPIATPPKVKVDTIVQISKYHSYMRSANSLVQIIYAGNKLIKKVFSKK